MAETHPGVTLITNDTSRETGLGRTTYEPFERMVEEAPFPVRLAVLDKQAKEVRVHHGATGDVTTKTLLRIPEHRYGFFFRASRHVPMGEINHVTNQVLSYLPVPNKVVTIHDLFFRTEDLSWAYKLHSYWLYPPLRDALHCFANSNATADEAVRVLGLDRDRITVLPMGVDPEPFSCELSPFEARRRLGLPVDAPLLLHLSTETPRKNVDGIIRALALVRSRPGLEETTFVKLGSPTRRHDRKANLALIEELGLPGAAVRFEGYVDEEDLPLYYRACDLLAFPSHQEGFGLPVLEAMAVGLPCVTSTVSALPEAAGDAAVLVDPTDVDAIADGIERVLTDEALRKGLVERGHRRVERFTWDATAQAQLETYERLLAHVRKAPSASASA